MSAGQKKIVIFASGSGTNAQNIIDRFKESTLAKVVHIYSNKPDAYVLRRAEISGIASTVFTRTDFKEGAILQQLKGQNPDLIVLAGFLWLFPSEIIRAFEGKIINIHPALLPAYGGKGMYGMKVHEAVINNKEEQSGITIHYINEQYDEGPVIKQATCDIEPNDSPDVLAEKIHKLEYQYYPIVIEELLRNA